MNSSIPRSFIFRRLHSLTGLWFLLFLIEHLLTNSQAALWISDEGSGFVKGVNFLHNLPYLQVIEIVLLGIPIAFHAVLGIKYALQAKMNSQSTNGTSPALGQYGRNRAYSWQRITSYFLLVMLIFHVVRFRFMEYPQRLHMGNQSRYFIEISFDPGLYSLSKKLSFQLYDKQAIESKIAKAPTDHHIAALEEAKTHFLSQENDYDPKVGSLSSEIQSALFEQAEAKMLGDFNLQNSAKLVAECCDFGTATLLAVRDTFKNKVYAGLYSLFVLAAVFHGCNGFWTFLITWGLILKKSAQKMMTSVSLMMMMILGFLGLAAIWGSYFITLKQ